MHRRKHYLLLVLVILFVSGCQFQKSETNKPSFPTPFQETLEADKARPTITTGEIPTLTPSGQQSSKTKNEFPVPTETQLTTTEIFPQATQASQSSQPEHHALADKIDQIIGQSGGRWHIVIKEMDGPTFYALLPEERINIASVVKVPLALLFFAALEEKGIPENQLGAHIQSTGTGGRTFDQLLVAMLVKSEEDATVVLAEYIALYVNIPAKLREWQLQGVDLEARRYTVAGIASLFERFYQGEFVSPSAQKLILGYLSEHTPNDDTRIGSLRSSIPENYQIYNKRGSLLTPYVVADSAILEDPSGSDYIITIFAYNSEPQTTYEILDQAIGEIALAFWEYISPEEGLWEAP